MLGTVFGSLFPGLRDIRAPFAAGYLWMFNLWFFLRDKIPPAESAEGLVGDVYAVVDYVGSGGTFVIVTFVSYLLGILSVSASQSILMLVARLGKIHSFREITDPTKIRKVFELGLSRQGVGDLIETCYENVAKFVRSKENLSSLLNAHPNSTAIFLAIASNISPGERRSIIKTYIKLENHIEAMADDFHAFPTRLMLEKPEAFSAYDRARSEAEFRSAVAIPLLSLVSILLYFNYLTAAAVTLVGVVWIMWLARRRLIESNDQLAQI